MFEKPREKLLNQGPKALDDHELIALILGSGNKRENVFTIAKRLIEEYDFEEFTKINTVKKFQENFHLGFVQACQLIAALELGKRFFPKEKGKTFIRSAEQAYEVLRPMQDLQKEYVRGLYLNTRYQLIHDEIITIGGLDFNIIHPREIFRPALEYNAFCFIIAHNHPSGDPTPSQEDLNATQKLSEIAYLLQISFLDHLIIGKENYQSIKRLNKAIFNLDL